MKIDLNAIDQTQFMMHPHIVNGETLWLVQPQHIGAKFTQDNKIFRSSVWNDQGELVSAGFPKFTNWGENPDHFPVPKSLKGCSITEKLDGSLLIVTKYKGNFILRTRGTVDAHKLDNGHELEIFERTILPKLVTHMSAGGNEDAETWDQSFLFEWVSPEQRIILNYGDTPEWYLVGIVGHDYYELVFQKTLDAIAKEYGLKRPVAYDFPSVETLMKDVEAWKGKEGVVVYSGDGQVLHKVKGAWYLALHRMKEALASIDKVIDVWYEQGEPTYKEFEKFIVDRFDWELWTQVQGDVSRICDAAVGVNAIVSGMKLFVNEKLKPLPNRKEQALQVISSYGKTNRASFVFKLLDGKNLDTEDRKKLMYQVLKK